MQETTLKIGGMTCGGCVANVEKILRGIDGVERADVSLDEGLARVRFDAQRTSVAQPETPPRRFRCRQPETAFYWRSRSPTRCRLLSWRKDKP